MHVTKPFTTGRSQALRLPKDCRFEDGGEICVSRIGDVVIAFPRRKGWEVMAASIEQFTDDFLADRQQAARAETREQF
ncbi:MAG: AbrB/MazE/SpoVT family DNA-binding domain-containing protein [Phycisphaerales bacterium]|nr:MAG: AbrB/MazE/SpoVT family DNA-binding domain-containing protein [Phycisphaerales bacterium]